MSDPIKGSELILNKDGSIYHLNLLPEDIAKTIITVGDPGRVSFISRYFDSVDLRKQHREFVTHSGYLKGNPITVVSTGIGTDNIDIVLNELDALVNIDFSTRQKKSTLTSLSVIRLGTCGGLQPQLDVDDFVVTEFAMGFDNLMAFYQYNPTSEERQIQHSALEYFANSPVIPYICHGDRRLIDHFGQGLSSGITASCGGFYGPQGRHLRGKLADENFVQAIEEFSFENLRVCNFEMETAGIYGLGNLLGHHCCSISTVVANRIKGTMTQSVDDSVDRLVQHALGKLGDLSSGY